MQSSKMNILLVNFGCSFTFNIYSWARDLFHQIKVIDHAELGEKWKSFDGFILGPGPGILEDYKSFYLTEIISSSRPLLGICLGHQFLGRYHGLSLRALKTPKHGASLSCPEWPEQGINQTLKAQFYNSWELFNDCSDSMDLWKQEDSVIGLKKENHLGFQFHPESIGTKHQELLKKVCSIHFEG